MRKGCVLLKRMIRGIHPSETRTATLRLKMEITPQDPGETITDGRCDRPGVERACHVDLCDAESAGEREAQVTLESEEGAASRC